MSYRMTEINEHVRLGFMSDGTLDIEVWTAPHGWRGAISPTEDDLYQVWLPPLAVDALKEFLGA